MYSTAPALWILALAFYPKGQNEEVGGGTGWGEGSWQRQEPCFLISSLRRLLRASLFSTAVSTAILAATEPPGKKLLTCPMTYTSFYLSQGLSFSNCRTNGLE